MKNAFLIPSLLFFILVNITSICFAQTKNNKTSKTANPVPQTTTGIKPGLDFLKIRNYKDAQIAFKKAKKGADKAQKKQCNELLKIAKQYNKIYFVALEKTATWRDAKDYRRLIAAYDAAKIDFQKIDRADVAAVLKPVDEQLMKRHSKDVQEFDQSRKAAWNAALKEAEKLSGTDPQKALAKVDYAKSQMYDSEFKGIGSIFENISKNARYNIFVDKGDSLALKGLGDEAWSSYQEAQKLKDTPEIKMKIKTLNDKLYTYYLKEGNEQADNGKYRAAYHAYEKALGYTDKKDEVWARKRYWLDYLFEKGKKAFALGKYKEADSFYDTADWFGYSDELQKARKEVEPYIEFEKYMDIAEKHLAEGNATEAQKALLVALKYRSNDRAQELKVKLEIYLEKLENVVLYLNKGDKAKAMECVNIALSQIPNGKRALEIKKTLETPATPKR